MAEVAEDCSVKAMIYLVIIEKLTPEGKKNIQEVLKWQKRLDEWLMSHGATWKSVKHYVTAIGEPAYETWLEYPNYAAFDEDQERAKRFSTNPEWQKLISQANQFFERVNSKVVKEIGTGLETTDSEIEA